MQGRCFTVGFIGRTMHFVRGCSWVRSGLKEIDGGSISGRVISGGPGLATRRVGKTKLTAEERQMAIACDITLGSRRYQPLHDRKQSTEILLFRDGAQIEIVRAALRSRTPLIDHALQAP